MKKPWHTRIAEFCRRLLTPEEPSLPSEPPKNEADCIASGGLNGDKLRLLAPKYLGFEGDLGSRETPSPEFILFVQHTFMTCFEQKDGLWLKRKGEKPCENCHIRESCKLPTKKDPVKDLQPVA